MELEDFVAQSLAQLVNGVVKAQRAVEGTGALISPHMRMTNEKHSIGVAEGYGGQPVTHVEFDIAIAATSAEGTKGGIGVVAGVFALGSQGQSDKSRGTESRIQFKVPVLLPLHMARK